MSHVHSTADPSAYVYATSDPHPPTTHSQCYCSHPRHSVPTYSVPFKCGEAAAMEDIQRLTHRAGFAENAFYAILHSNALKDKDNTTEAIKVERLIEGVQALARQSLRLSQDASIQLSERLDASIQTLTRSREGLELKLDESQETFKNFMESIRAEIQSDRTQLLEALKHQIRQASAEKREPDDSWVLDQILSEREAELIQAKEDLRVARIEHANTVIISNSRKKELDSLKNELAGNKAQTSLVETVKAVKLENQKAMFAIQQMLKGRYTSDEWIEQAPKDLSPFDFGDELIALGRKLSDACRVHNMMMGVHHIGSEKPESFPACSLNGDDLGTVEEDLAVSDRDSVNTDHDFDTSDTLHAAQLGAEPISTAQSSSSKIIGSDPLASEDTLERPSSSINGYILPGIFSMRREGVTAIAVKTATMPSKKTLEKIKLKNKPRIAFQRGETIADVVVCQSSTLWLGTNAAGERGWFNKKKVQLR